MKSKRGKLSLDTDEELKRVVSNGNTNISCVYFLITVRLLPIDPDFQNKREKIGEEEGVAIWGPIDPPKKLGIRGTNVAVDWDVCEGNGICIEVCPVQLYEWRETPGHPTSEKKAFPAREDECIQCLACEIQCPVQAIKITPP